MSDFQVKKKRKSPGKKKKPENLWKKTKPLKKNPYKGGRITDNDLLSLKEYRDLEKNEKKFYNVKTNKKCVKGKNSYNTQYKEMEKDYDIQGAVRDKDNFANNYRCKANYSLQSNNERKKIFSKIGSLRAQTKFCLRSEGKIDSSHDFPIYVYMKESKNCDDVIFNQLTGKLKI